MKTNFLLKMKAVFLLIFFIAVQQLRAQEKISLESCREKAKANFFGLQKEGLWHKTEKNALSVLKAAQMPRLLANAEAKYLSDVPSPDLPMGGFPELPKDQYKFYITANQLIYQGGYLLKLKDLETMKTDVELRRLELDWYRKQERIDALYFSALLLNQHRKSVGLSLQTLDERLKEANVAVELGAVEGFERDYLLAERFSLEERRQTFRQQLEAVLRSLGIYMNETIDSVERLSAQGPGFALDSAVVRRKEIEIMECRQRLLGQRSRVVKTQRMPKFEAFGSAGYGQPGLNAFKPGFDFYYQAGAKLSWNIYDWKKNKSQRKLNDLEAERISLDKQQFRQDLSAALTDQRSRLAELQGQIRKDREELALRARILEAETSRLRNGVISGADYVKALNQRQAVRLRLHRREILLVQAEYALQHLLGY
ncbi:MAG: TolC family protein [Cytophagales bacterium]|nr:TolC family protein [Cytophagales bacterium]